MDAWNTTDVGGGVAAAVTVMVAVADEPVAPTLSTAVALSAYVPAGTLDHVNA